MKRIGMTACRLGLLCSVIVLAGCTRLQTAENNQDGGLFAQSWENIGSSEAQVSVKDGEETVQSRRSLDYGGGEVYLEALELENGSMLYGRYQQGRPEEISAGELLRSKISSTDIFQQRGYNLLEETVQQQELERGGLAYGVLYSSQERSHCLFFVRDHQERDDAPYEIVFGTFCNTGAENTALREDLDQFVSNHSAGVSQIAFDRGTHARNSLFAKADNRLAQIRKEAGLIEKNPPLIEIEQAWRHEGELVVRGRITDDSGVDVVWLSGVLVEIDDAGSFFVRIEGGALQSQAPLIAIDLHGNAATEMLDTFSSTEPPSGGAVYALKSSSGVNRALLIAVDDYQTGGSKYDLDTPGNDALMVRSILEDQYQFQVEVMRNPTNREVRSRLNALSSQLEMNDKLVIYYAGHGYLYPSDAPAHEQSSYWLMADFDDQSPDEWISDSEIRRIVSKIPSRQVMLVSDSCYSGKLAGASDAIFNQESGADQLVRTVMTSGSVQPVPDSFDKVNSPFALAFVEGLGERIQSIGTLLGHALYGQVIDIMTKSGNQHQQPQYGTLVEEIHEPGGDFVVK